MGGLSKRSAALIGVACAVICAVCVLLYLHEVRDEAEAARTEALARYGGEQVEVCVATRDIAAGETVDITSVKTMLWVADLLPEDAVRDSDDIVGKQVTSRILEGEVVSLKRFESQTFTLEVPTGLSAVSVPAKDVQAVGGAIVPGMKVNIFATGDSTTSLLAQDILVLATSASVAGGDSDTSVTWITVAVDPAMVEELVAAAQGTQLYFALPGTEEVSVAAENASDTNGDAGDAENRSDESGSDWPATEADESAESTVQSEDDAGSNADDNADTNAGNDSSDASAGSIKRNIDEIVMRDSDVGEERETEGDEE